MPTITPARAALFVIAACAAVLGGALLFQYPGGLHPCALCFAQRWPYYFAIGLAVLARSLTRDPGADTTVRALLIIIALVFLGGAALATYHVGIEQQWWAGTKACGGGLRATGLSLEDLRKRLLDQPIVRCDRPAWTLFGISLAGFNVAISLGLAVITAALARVVARDRADA
ncbi:MAG: disulfide bond formation protein B [Alphaproteobacteria bacterium]|nr:disulfide bond formation protein B [Alphaproteobacteria bacterium]